MTNEKRAAIRHTSMMAHKDNYTYCFCCGHRWAAADKWLYWPVKLGWRRDGLGRHWLWSTHGWQAGIDGPDRRVFGWTVRIWRLLIKFGSMSYEGESRYDKEYGIWVHKCL